jgi:hypothetical protein
MNEAARSTKAKHMENLVRSYMKACSDSDADAIAACLTPDCIHYFPPDMYDGPFRGARTIANKWVEAVEKLGSYWTVDNLVVSPETNQAVAEWSHFKTKLGITLRGAEWYVFDDESGLIKDIRAYYASPQAEGLNKLELGSFDYEGNGYPMGPPPGTRD